MLNELATVSENTLFLITNEFTFVDALLPPITIFLPVILVNVFPQILISSPVVVFPHQSISITLDLILSKLLLSIFALLTKPLAASSIFNTVPPIFVKLLFTKVNLEF